MDYLVSIKLTGDASDAQAAFKQVEGGMQGLERTAEGATSNVGSSFTQLGTVIQGAIAGAIVNFGLEGISQLRELGAEVDFTRDRFDALLGADSLDGLRDATHGTVSDFQLMQDSLAFVMTGVASDAQEAGQLIDLALSLAGQEGVEAMGRALKNQSIEMLDNLGISAAAVRELRDQYTAAGMDSAEAFTRAVLEIGEQTRDSLGDAAQAGYTAWAQVSTQLENVKDQIAEIVGNAGETAAQIALIVENSIEQARNAGEEAQRINDQVLGRGTVISGQLSTGIAHEVNPEFLNQYVSDVLRQLAENPEMANQAELTGEQIGMFVQQGLEASRGDPTIDLIGGEAVWQQYLAQIANVTFNQNKMMEDAATIQQRNIEQARAGAQQLATDWQTAQTSIEGYLDAYREWALSADDRDTMNLLEGVIGQGVSGANEIDRTRHGMRGGVEFYTQAEADQLHQMQTDAQNAFDQLKELHEQGIVSDTHLESARQYVEYISGVADAADRGVEAADKLDDSLSSLFGQSGGGAYNEIDQQILAGLESGGMSEDQLAAIQDQLAIDSGTETALSQDFEQNVLPALIEIAQTQGAQAAADYRRAYIEGIQTATIEGSAMPTFFDSTGLFNVGGDFMTMPTSDAGAPSGITFDQSTGAFTNTSGEAQSQMPDYTLVESSMKNIGDSATTWKLATDGIVEGLPALSTNFDNIDKTVATTHTNMSSINDFIAGLVSQEQTIRFNIEAGYSGQTPQWFQDMFARQWASMVAANGGAVPGTDPRAT